ncbi:ParB/RepB/Spo0J family partition protein [Ethanoligenens harbinense]|uniref:ParB domain protein nuclease n=1 Tax=Ethanoligenens harbinense (strain DSM 18485 / JCM 12961 / CGMCC 1.5033 / YUAN-3) TaxID=663278 RepID=E6U5S3_ETHHY|nr:ParB/RepB/Spo0J family partition protein [Ethanoligenens harbinense]ADU27940.1 ParB domain protein nuclease [Ethanoligenens harbinense YUAN-3]AVQ96969.1 hypothetical protein CXQ68_12565 [Ethanoligenens harbinense YUAN-3]AYF39629.1 hypothetical protein CXP51_12460 [Ethanoligenens harbinense]AYF42457.1 hypothetical protein CN246_13015 [Ethanoligenens harbinense]QCN93210.1 hypothetical protein DRA42_12610 [Ethanoligenens harbinense]
MNTYYTKCGRSFKKSTKADTTGYQMAQQIEADGSLGRVMDIECQKCPFVVDVKEGWPARHKRYECRAGSKPPNHQSDWIGSLDDKCSIYVRSLDHDLCDRIISYCKENPYLAAGYNQDRPDCRRTVSISCAANKKGVAAKKEVIKTFFPDIAVTPDPTDDSDDLADSMTEEYGKMAKFNADAILNSAKEVAQQTEGLEPVPELKEIRCELIDLNPDNAFAKKDTQESIEELATDIRAHSLLHPIVVNHVDGRYRLISGERRFRAVTEVLNWQVVDAKVFENLVKIDEMEMLYAANFQVRQYTAAELLEHYQRLVQFFQTEDPKQRLTAKDKDKIARFLNVTRRQVNKYARIMEALSEGERQAIMDKSMSINKANDLAKERAQKAERSVAPSKNRKPVPAAPRQQASSSTGSHQKATEESVYMPPLPASPLSENQEPVPGRVKLLISQKSEMNQEPVPAAPVHPVPHETLNNNESSVADVARQINEITTGLYLLGDMLKKSGIDARNPIREFVETMQEYLHEYAGK